MFVVLKRGLILGGVFYGTRSEKRKRCVFANYKILTGLYICFGCSPEAAVWLLLGGCQGWTLQPPRLPSF